MFNWKVLHVKPRCEKKALEFCRIYGIPSYLPLTTKRRIVQRRKVITQLPLFPGYVFAAFPKEKQGQVMATNQVARILVPEAPWKLMRELSMVMRVLRANPEVSAEEPLEHGMKVRIIDGPFMGVCGIVERLEKQMRVIVNIEMVGQAVGVSAERAQVTRVED